MLYFLTSGESHGPMLVTILDGLPAGLAIDIISINKELEKRQQGFGRGNRQKIEKDSAEIAGGIRHGITTGAPVSMLIRNRDFENWQQVMSVTPVNESDPEVIEQLLKRKISSFRPGHADLAGTLKFRQKDIRDVREMASARETAARVAVGAACTLLLKECGIQITSHVIQIGNAASKLDVSSLSLPELEKQVLASEVFCACPESSKAMKEAIQAAWQQGDSLGGVVEVLVDELPVGLGSYTQWDKRLDGQLAQAVMSVQSVKGVEIGDGINGAGKPGSVVHDALYPAEPGRGLPFTRKTNHAGGLEGGVTNGSSLVLRAYLKPISTLRQGLPSLSFPEFTAETAHYERSDVCAVPAGSIVVKAMVSFVLARAMLEKFGSDTMIDLLSSLDRFRQYCCHP